MFEEFSNFSAHLIEDQDKAFELSKQLSAEKTNTNGLYRCSNNSKPDIVQGRNFFLPDFEAENPFFSNITLTLIRDLSTDDPLRDSVDCDLKIINDLGDKTEISDELAISCESSEARDWNSRQCEKEFTQNDVFKNSESNLIEAESYWSTKSEDNVAETAETAESAESKLQDIKNESDTGKFSPIVEKTQYKSTKKAKGIVRKKIQKEKSEAKPKASKKDKKTAKSKKIAKDSKKEMKESKNVVKNYGKAMAAFSLNELALPYLQRSLLEHDVTLEEYNAFIINKKETIDSIGSLRDAMFSNPGFDTPRDMKLKAVFRDMSEIFVRDYALNWIFSCRSQYKSTLLGYRFKILRRVRDPAYFTYLKSY